jgi:hypothetical protein
LIRITKLEAGHGRRTLQPTKAIRKKRSAQEELVDNIEDDDSNEEDEGTQKPRASRGSDRGSPFAVAAAEPVVVGVGTKVLMVRP